jgi:hypothetical protein
MTNEQLEIEVRRVATKEELQKAYRGPYDCRFQ